MNQLSVIGNKYAIEVLKHTKKQMTAPELSEEINAPIATIYRRVDELSNTEFLEVCNPIDEKTGRPMYYRRTTDKIEVEL